MGVLSLLSNPTSYTSNFGNIDQYTLSDAAVWS